MLGGRGRGKELRLRCNPIQKSKRHFETYQLGKRKTVIESLYPLTF